MFSTTFRYSLISLLELANSEELLQASAIASRHQLSPHYLAAVLAELRRLGLVHSQKGKKGGYRLACQPRHVNLLELYNSLAGGTEDLRHHAGSGQDDGELQQTHTAERWLSSLVNRWMSELASTSLADLLSLEDLVPIDQQPQQMSS